MTALTILAPILAGVLTVIGALISNDLWGIRRELTRIADQGDRERVEWSRPRKPRTPELALDD
jgi:hypothetical protein